MAKRSPAQCTCRFLILLAALSVTTFVPLQTEAVVEVLTPFFDLMQFMHTAKSGLEVLIEKPLYKKLGAVIGEGKQNYELYEKKIHGIIIDDGGNCTGRSQGHFMVLQDTHDSWTGKLPVLAVDVTNMFSWTTSCDFNSPGLWLVSCNSPLCQQNADRPPYCATDDNTPCDPDNTWGLFNASLARYLEAAADPQQAQTPVWHLCIAMSSSEEEEEGVDAVLGLARGPAGTLPATLTTFSYLLTSNGHTSVWLGDDTAAPAPQQALLIGHSTIRVTTTTIQLISNPKHPELYYVHLKAIQVDGTELELEHPGILDLDPETGDGGVFMSSIPVRPWTYLNRAAYQNLVDKFKNLLSPAEPVPGPDQLCYRNSSLAAMIPKLALVFDDGAVMELHRDNYWGRYINGSSQLQCLAILPSPWTTGESMLGSQLQWGWRMTYDLHNSLLRATTTLEEEAPPATSPPHFPPPASAATRLRILPLL